MAGFDPWYSEIIERFSPEPQDQAGAQRRATLAAACIIAQALDNLAEKLDEGLAFIGEPVGQAEA